jgi:large repetitive protein
MKFCTRTISKVVFSLCLLFLGMTTTSAQNGQYDVRFTIKNFDCATNRVTVVLQVKAHDAAHTFFMGDANYRFDYDPRVIKNPTIVSQENFSNQPPSSDLNYIAQNPNGSSVGPTLGTVSINTIYGSGGLGAKLVPATWTNVSCIRFDVQDATKCMELIWHDDQRFPITGMSEVVLSGLNDGSYDVNIVPAGGVFQNYSVCIPTVCTGMTAIDDINVTNKNAPVSGSAATNDVSLGGAMTFTMLSQPATSGNIVLNPNGTYAYTPATNFVGEHKAIYQVCNAAGVCDTATLTISILDAPVAGVNNAPVAQNDNAQTLVNAPVTGNVLTNDLDQNGNTLVVTTTPTTAPTNGTVVLNPDGTFVYTPVNGFAGQDTFKYKVCDNGTPVMCDTAMVVITVTVDNNSTGNDKPAAQDDSKTTLAGTPVTIPVKANDTDPNGNTLGAPSVITTPTNGTAVVNADGTITYTPNPNYIGPDKFTYSVCDNGSPVLCDTATVYVDVTPVPNYPPVIVKTPITTPEDSTKTICIAVSDQNVGQTLTPSLCSGYPKNGTAGVPTIVNGSVCFTYTPTANYNGVDTLCLIVCDNGTPSRCDTAKIPVTVTPVADKPVVTKTPVTTTEDTPVTVCQTISDADAGSTFTASLCSQPGHGVAGTPIVTGNQVCVQYSPAANYAGTDTVCIVVCDATGLCDTAKVPVTVTPVNDPPVITGSPVTTTDKTPITVCLPIADPDAGDTFTPSLCGSPATGTTSTPVINNGQICVQYLPVAGALGPKTICIKVCDAAGLCDTAQITVNVVPSNQAPVASNDINNTSKNVPANGNVLVNDMDPDFNPLTPSVVKPAQNGNFVLNPNGSYVYTPATGFTGTDSITYKVCDNGTPSLCDTALVVIEVRDPGAGTNQAPVASDDNTSTPAGRPVTVAVTSNDFDPDNGQTITAPTLVGTPVGGTPSVNPDGTIKFTPTPGFLGDATFQYKVCDNGTPVLCDTATVTVRVFQDPTVINAAPIAVDDANTTTGVTPVSGSVATNDYDPNGGQLLTFVGLTNPTKGTVTVNPNGTYTYTANPATSGLDSFKYKVCDNGIPVMCDTGTVMIFVNPVVTPPTNLAPVATPDNPVTTTGIPVTINVKGNDFDPNGDPIGNPTITSPPTCGTTVVNADGTIKFTPNAGFTGSCSFIYQVCDNGSPVACDTALVTVKVDPTPLVNLPPVAINDGFVATTGVTLSGKSVATNDSDPNVGQVLTYSQLSFPAKGLASFGGTGTFTYFPSASFVTGIDSFKYRVCDNGSPILCDTATVFVEYTATPVGNVAPIALNDNAGTTSGTKVNIPVKTNDGDPNGVGTLGTPTVPVQPACGTATVLANGTIDFTPNAGYVGDCSFKYVICDNGTPSLCDTATVTVTVIAPPAPANRAPITQNDATTTSVNTPVNGSVALNDTDLDAGQTLTFAKLTNPFNGSVVVNPDGTYTYTPNAAFVGRDSFTYRVCDNGTPSLCATATAVIVVTPSGVNQNDKPIAGDDQATTTPGTPVVINVKLNDIDPDGASNTLGNPVIIGTPVGGTPSVNPDGTVTFTPTPGFTGLATFTYKVCDNGSPVMCDTASVTIDVKTPAVNNVNLAPVAIDDAKTGIKNQNILGNVATNDSDPNVGQVLNYTIVSQTTNGLVASLNPTTGAFVYTPLNNFVGSDYFTYSVCDNGSPVLCDTAIAYLTVLNNPCVTIQLKALIEGPYSTATGKMRTALNQRGLLPGQTPIGQFAVKTEKGHPYKGAPWNYSGTEGDTITSYPATVVDWVLVSLRTAAGTLVPAWRCAAWLHEDGSITIPGKPCVQIPSGNYFIVIEHRNHLGVMSPAAVTVANNSLNFDFTTGDGFVLTNPPSFGAKAMSNGKWVMYAGDGKKDTQNTNFDINFNDSQLWKLQSGIFDQYRYGDFNLDADVNFSDQVLWKANNGRYSGVAH